MSEQEACADLDIDPGYYIVAQALIASQPDQVAGWQLFGAVYFRPVHFHTLAWWSGVPFQKRMKLVC